MIDVEKKRIRAVESCSMVSIIIKYSGKNLVV